MNSTTQQKMTLVACRLLIIFTWVTTFTRPLVVDLNVAFTLIGIVEGIIALLLYATVRAELLGRSAPVIVALALPLMCTPLILISGGVNSPITYILPIFPFYATLITGPRFSCIATAVICAGIIPLGLYTESIVDALDAPYSDEVTHARTYWIIASLVVGAIFSSCFTSLTEILSKMLREEANMDFLTKTTNRLGLEKILDREANTARRHDSWLSLIILNIDDFKKFNDRFGQASGDECLIRITESLRIISRVKQDYIGRWSNEEFILVLPDTDPDETESIAELVRREIEFMRGNKSEEAKNVTVTLGCCSARGRDTRTQQMLKVAEKALKDGKARGKNKVVVAQISTPVAKEEPVEKLSEH